MDKNIDELRKIFRLFRSGHSVKHSGQDLFFSTMSYLSLGF